MTNEITLWRRGDAYPADWPQWLRDADIDFCSVEITYDGTVIWHGGVWRDGSWHGGVWRGGVWHGGEWRDGVWFDGDWHGGIWHGGVWRDGSWHGGEWRDGEAWRTDGPPPCGEARDTHGGKR